jgi:hypothetical protein
MYTEANEYLYDFSLRTLEKQCNTPHLRYRVGIWERSASKNIKTDL